MNSLCLLTLVVSSTHICRIRYRSEFSCCVVYLSVVMLVSAGCFIAVLLIVALCGLFIFPCVIRFSVVYSWSPPLSPPDDHMTLPVFWLRSSSFFSSGPSTDRQSVSSSSFCCSWPCADGHPAQLGLQGTLEGPCLSLSLWTKHPGIHGVGGGLSQPWPPGVRRGLPPPPRSPIMLYSMFSTLR